jgi:hypothetical protein
VRRSRETPARVVTALVVLTVAIIEGSRRGYGSTPIVGLFSLGAVATVALACPPFTRVDSHRWSRLAMLGEARKVNR